MEELIAKRYIKALKNDVDSQVLENISSVFEVLAESFNNDKFVSIIANPEIAVKYKSEMLLEAVKPANSEKINNLIKLLVENKRITIIPAISKELKKDLANSSKTYEGSIYSDSDIDTKVIEELSKGLSKKFDSKISFFFIKNDISYVSLL